MEKDSNSGNIVDLGFAGPSVGSIHIKGDFKKLVGWVLSPILKPVTWIHAWAKTKEHRRLILYGLHQS